MQHLKPVRGSHLITSHPLALGLVGAWLMNEGTGSIVADSSLHHNKGTLSGVDWTPGIHGHALKSDAATDYTDLGNIGVLDYAPEATVILKLMLTSVSVTRDLFVIGTHALNQPFLFYPSLGAPNRLTLLITDNAGHTTGGKTSNFVPLPNVWYHLAVVFRGDINTRLYINSIEDTGGGFPISHPTVSDIKSNDTYTIGNDDVHTSRGLLGLIDHVLLYRRALTVAEIGQLYREPFAMFDHVPKRFSTIAVGGVVPLEAHLAYYSTISSLLKISRFLQTVAPSSSDIISLLKVIRYLKSSLSSNAAIVANLTTIEEVLLSTVLVTSSTLSGMLKITRRFDTSSFSASSVIALLKSVRSIKASLSSSTAIAADLTVPGVKLMSTLLSAISAISAKLTVPVQAKFLWEKWTQYARRHPQKSSSGRTYFLDAYLMCRKVNMRNLQLGLPMQEEPPVD